MAAIENERGPGVSVAADSLLEAGPAPVERPGITLEDVTAGAPGEAFALCREITRSRARNFYHGLRLTPEPKRSALYAVYAWMREADDIADGAGTDEARGVRLARFASHTEAVFSGESVGGAWWPAFAKTYHAFALGPALFERTIEAVRADIEAEPGVRGFEPLYDDRAGLERYCEGVASTVGVLCLRVWGVRDRAEWPGAHALAIKRGVAFQLTNILRDIHEDAEEGRCYVPGEVLAAHGLSAPGLCAWEDASSCEAVVRDLVAWARSMYDASAPLDAHVHADGQAPMWAMTRIYSGLLERIAQDPMRTVLGPRVRLPGAVKVGIALRAAVRARLAG